MGNHSRAVAVGIVQKRYGGEVGSPSTRKSDPVSPPQAEAREDVEGAAWEGAASAWYQVAVRAALR